MSKQFKYAFKSNISEMLILFAVTIITNLIFIIGGKTNLMGFKLKTFGVTLSALSLTVVIAFCVVIFFKCAEELFFAPMAYTVNLAPIPFSKVLFARIIAYSVVTFINLAVAVMGVVFQSLNIANISYNMVFSSHYGSSIDIKSKVFALSGYLLMIMFLFFMIAYNRSLKGTVRFRKLLTFAVGIVVSYICAALPGLLGFIYGFEKVGPLTYVVNISFNTGVAFYLILIIYIIEIVALFVGTTKLMEKKVNL